MKLKHDVSSIEKLELHLMRCDYLFTPRLSSRVDIHQYSEKIRLNGFTVEYWDNENLVACIAYYRNNDINEIFITNVSVEEEYQSKGIASMMIEELEKSVNFKRAKLEVHKENTKALNLYLKNGFKKEDSGNDTYILIKDEARL